MRAIYGSFSYTSAFGHLVSAHAVQYVVVGKRASSLRAGELVHWPSGKREGVPSAMQPLH